MMRTCVTAGLFLAALAAGATAGPAGPPVSPPTAASPLGLVDWQEPDALPPQFRNHCTTGGWFGRPYCADHCGREFQLYYCSPASYGCCKVGFGYCDSHGHLRCHP